MQIDLIDMQSRPDGDYKYIGHFVDHFTKYHVLFAMKSKSANIVASNLVHKVFSYFGVPKIPHSDNGREFVNRVIENIIKSWPGRVQLITGRPRHSQTQGLVEQGNYTVERMLSALFCDTGSNSWASWLPRIQCKTILAIKVTQFLHKNI